MKKRSKLAAPDSSAVYSKSALWHAGISQNFSGGRVSESDHELVRLDAEAIDTLSIGFGVLARLHKGSQLSFLRRK